MNSFFLCHNTGFIEEYLLPQIKEILVEYEPDGLWFDGDVWVSRVCYCASCQERYRELHGREVPRPADEEDWPLAPEFARETYLEYLQKVRDLIQEVRPECLFSVNWLHTLSNPWASRGKVDWLSGDVPLNHGVNAAGREARFMNHQGLPFDIMICDFSLDYRTRGYMYHKSAEQMKQEAAAVVANGARLFYWMTPNRDASFRVEDPPTTAEVGRFVRDRQPYCTATESVRDIAILVSAAGWAADPKIRHETEDTLRVFAAQQMLLESGLHHDLVSEDAFLKSDADWHAVILPGVDGLSEALLKGPREIRPQRGNLLLGLPLPEDRCAKLTGVERWAENDIEDDPLAGIAHRVLLPSGWARVYYPAARAVEPHAEPRGQLWQAQGFEAIPQQPVSYVNRLGDGTVITCAGSVFDGYRQVQGPPLRDLVMAELRFLHPQPVAELDPPGQLEVSVRQREGRVAGTPGKPRSRPRHGRRKLLRRKGAGQRPPHSSCALQGAPLVGLVATGQSGFWSGRLRRMECAVTCPTSESTRSCRSRFRRRHDPDRESEIPTRRKEMSNDNLPVPFLDWFELWPGCRRV